MSLRKVCLQPPKIVYMSNVTGRALRNQDAIADDLASDVAHGIRWYDATTVLAELGCDLFLEMPPGHVLSQLSREDLASVRTAALDDSSIEYCVRLAIQLDHR
jgi:malonate decarboxylase epsilon subunit